MKLTRSALAVSVACTFTAAACSDELTTPTPLPPQSAQNIAAGPINPGAVPTYSQERPGSFVDMPDTALWKHVEYSERTAVVGLRKPGVNRGVYRGRVLVSRSEWEHARRAITSQQGVELIWADTLLPTLKVRFQDFGSFQKTRTLPITDFIEPLRALEDIPSFAEGSLGCHNQREWTKPRLYTNLGDVYSLKHRAMGIEHAWRRTNGSGVTVGVIDTGIHNEQNQLLPASLGGNFDAGESNGRWIKYRSAWTGNDDVPTTDHCGHGTEAAGVVVAPKDGSGPVGIAWKSNLVSVRIANGVTNVNSDDAQHGIRAAVVAMESGTGGKVITMSWQSMNWWWQVSNEIDYWKNQHPNDLLFFAAAGTSGDDWLECGLGMGGGTLIGGAVAFFNPLLGLGIYLAGSIAGCVVPDNSNVVFPAEHASVVAVTCIDMGTGDVSNNCHHGSKVEFSAYQAFPTVHGASPLVDRLGGASGAAPTVAGQAALIWSHYPWMTSTQVLDRMRWAARVNRDSRQGYGIVNTYKAVGGMHGTWIDDSATGGGFNQVAYHQLHAGHVGGDGPYTCRWSNGNTSSTINVAIGPNEPDQHYSVVITDASDGGSAVAELTIFPPPGGCEDPDQVVCHQ
jgi:hypothetical protein